MRHREHGRHGHMPGGQRLAVYVVLGTLWLSGCLWLLLDQYFSGPGEFGKAPNALQPPILLIHGIVAILSMYLLGWVTSRHVLKWWRGRLRRLSGGALATFFVLLTLSGFALFFVSDDRWQRASVVVHDILGLAVTVFAVQHWFFARPRDIRRADSRP